MAQPALEHILELLDDQWPELVAGTVDAIVGQVPAYARSQHPELLGDLANHVDVVFRVLVKCLREDRLAVREDFPITRDQAQRRIDQGVGLSDFLQAFRIGQMHIWNGILDAVGDDPDAREIALRLVDKVMHVIEVGSTVAAEGYLEAQQHNVADQDRRVRDLFEDLLRQEDVSTEAKQAMLRSAGLLPPTDLVVFSAVPVSGTADDRMYRFAVTAVRAGRSAGLGGMAATRRDELVGAIPVARDGMSKTIVRLENAVRAIARTGMSVSVGVSTVRRGLAEVPEAYAEAVLARNALADRPGFLALATLSTFDYLVLREDETARRLVQPELRRFVEQDLARGGELVTTLEAYAACNLNAKTVAQRLHLHVNTVYYRLNKVAERTGRDLRSFPDVMEVVIAVRLLRKAPAAMT